MKCSKCQFENPEDAKSVMNVATNWKLLVHHAVDKSFNSKFCNECGHSLIVPIKPVPKELSFDEKLAEIQRYLPEDLTRKSCTERQDRRGTEAGHSDVLRHGGIYFAYGEAWFRTNVLHNG